MERISSIALLAAISIMVVGCGSTDQAKVTKEEEEMFKHPTKGDASKIPPDAFKPKGPAFIGEPSTGTVSTGAPPPPAVK